MLNTEQRREKDAKRKREERAKNRTFIKTHVTEFLEQTLVWVGQQPPLPQLHYLHLERLAALPKEESEIWTNRSKYKFYACCGELKNKIEGPGSNCHSCRAISQRAYLHRGGYKVQKERSGETCGQ